MAAGFAGYLVFCGIKAAGYTLAAPVISRAFDRRDVNSFGVGGVRTLIGMGAAAILLGLGGLLSELAVPGFSNMPPVAIVIATLTATRLLEWWLLIWLFYRRRTSSRGKDWGIVSLGVLWSYVLDIPAIVGWFVAGDFPAC